MSDWQPIETAPTGRPLLLFYPEGEYDGAWNDYEGRSLPAMAVMTKGERGFWQGYYSGTTPDGDPTHWMPLPPPPVSA